MKSLAEQNRLGDARVPHAYRPPWDGLRCFCDAVTELAGRTG
jgi:hypothetical protein